MTWRSGHRSAARTPGQAMPRGWGCHGEAGGTPDLTGGEHWGFTPNLLQLLNKQGVHLSLQGPGLSAGALRPGGHHLGAARAAGARGGGAAAARTLGGPSAASALGRMGGSQRVCPGTGLLADGHMLAHGPRAGWPPTPQALSLLSGAGAHHALHAGGSHLGRPRALGCTQGPPLPWAPRCRCLTSGAAASRLLPGQGLQSRAGAGGCHVEGLPLGARVLRAQDQLRKGLVAWLLALGRGAGCAPQEPLTNRGPGWGPPSSRTVQGAGLWASEEKAF